MTRNCGVGQARLAGVKGVVGFVAKAPHPTINKILEQPHVMVRVVESNLHVGFEHIEASIFSRFSRVAKLQKVVKMAQS